MTGPEYATAIKALGLSKNGAGRFFGYHAVSGHRWAVDGPPEPVAMILRICQNMGWTLDELRQAVREPQQ